MPEHDVRGDRAVYDHETEDPRSARRRPVADWGVGEEIFDRMPSRRRFGRTGEVAPHRRESHPRERRVEPANEPAPRREDESQLREAAPREPAPREPAPRQAAPASPRGGIEGRRTVVIAGQASAARRPRPSRTVGERVGPRPDRLAAYAVALGLLLIVIAFLTQ
jgi:hypothetical protein